MLATLIALSIGLHNFGEGLAVAQPFPWVKRLGSFLVVVLFSTTSQKALELPHR